MDDTLIAIQLRERAEVEVQRKILALIFSKPLEQFTSIPKDWGHCSHVDYQTDKMWPDLERETMPMIGNLVGHLANQKKNPVDVCIVRRSGVFSVVVQTE